MNDKFSNAAKTLLSEKVRINIYAAAFILYIFETMLFETFYREIPVMYTGLAIIRNVCYLLLLLKLFLDFFAKSFSIKELFFIASISFLFLISTVIVKNKNLLIFFTFIVGANNISLKKIIKWSLITHIVAMLFIIGTTYIGIIQNNVIIQGHRNRESLGFLYPTTGAHYGLYVILKWLYVRRNKINWFEILAALLAAGFLYWKTDTRSPFMLSIIVISGGVVLKYVDILRRYHKLYSLIAIMCVPVACIAFLIIAYKFSWENVFIANLNRIINGRLNLAHDGLMNYGISLFGQHIVWIGGIPGPGEVYNYVDSSYAMLLINYGIVIFTIVMLWAEVCSIQIVRQKDTYMAFIWTIIAIHAICDPQFFWIGFNSFLMMYMHIRNMFNEKQVF